MKEQLQSKFIDNTNKQYSIRNDGVVVKHYCITKYKTIIYANKQLAIKQKDNTVQLTINGVCKRLYITKLLSTYFNIKPIIITKPRDTSKASIHTKRYRDKQIKNVSPYYIKSLNRQVTNIPNGLNILQKQLILTKRQIKSWTQQPNQITKMSQR